MDLGGKLHMQGDSINVDAHLKGLRLETLMDLDKESTEARGASGKFVANPCKIVSGI